MMRRAGERFPATSLAAGATGADLHLTSTLEVDGAATLDGAVDVNAAMTTRNITVDAGSQVSSPTVKTDTLAMRTALGSIAVSDDMIGASGKFLDFPTVKADAIDDSGAAAITVSETIAMAAAKHVEMGSGGKLKIDASSSTSDCPLQVNGDANTGLRVVGADSLGAVTGGTERMPVNNGGVGSASVPFFASAIYLQESAGAPSAAANTAILYSLDSATKTQLRAKLGGAGTDVLIDTEV